VLVLNECVVILRREMIFHNMSLFFSYVYLLFSINHHPLMVYSGCDQEINNY